MRKDKHGKERPKNEPYNVRTGGHAMVNNPTTWATFDQAVAAYVHGSYSGIGYMFSVDDPYTGVDLDKCMTHDGITPWGAETCRGAEQLHGALVVGHWSACDRSR